MVRLLLPVAVAVLILFSVQAFAGPGSYSLRAKGGPSFNLKDSRTLARVGGEFDYDFGYSIGFNLMAMFGIGKTFRFDLIPSFRYDYLFLGPASMYVLGGVGYTVFDKQSGLGMRLGIGITMPLGDRFEFNTDVNLFLVPVGTPGTPVNLDWLMGFGVHFD
ncbi:MAG: hypothetical protein V1798_05330 [Pseudomonadota bacterium]